MLRTLCVVTVIALGAHYTLQGGVFYALLFYIWNAYFRPEEWIWWSSFARSLQLSLYSGLYVVLASLLSGQRFVLNGRIVLLLCFLIQTLLSTLMAEHFAYSWSYWTEFFRALAITYMLVVLVQDFAQLRLVLLVMTLSLGLEGAKEGWFYLLTSPGWAVNANPIPFLGDNNGVAVGMLMLVPMVTLLARTAQRKWALPFYWILLIGVLYRALSTFSRGGFLAFLALGGAYCLHARHKLRVLLGIVVVASIIGLALPQVFWDRMHTIIGYAEGNAEVSFEGRRHFWAVALEMAKANPLLGVGFNGYNPAYDAYDFADGSHGSRRAVHSSVFGVLAELGYPGLLLYALIIVNAFRSCHRARRLAADDSTAWELGESAFALQTSLVVFLVGGNFLSMQYNEMLWHMLGLTIVLEELVARHAQADTATAAMPEVALAVSSHHP